MEQFTEEELRTLRVNLDGILEEWYQARNYLNRYATAKNMIGTDTEEALDETMDSLEAELYYCIKLLHNKGYYGNGQTKETSLDRTDKLPSYVKVGI